MDALVTHLERRLGVVARRTRASSTVSHCPSTRRLRELVPEFGSLGFGPGYFRSVVTAIWPRHARERNVS